MPKKILISYRHTDGDWVWGQLKPCLEAGGAEVLIDKERFLPGRNVYHQMVKAQDQADVDLLFLGGDSAFYVRRL